MRQNGGIGVGSVSGGGGGGGGNMNNDGGNSNSIIVGNTSGGVVVGGQGGGGGTKGYCQVEFYNPTAATTCKENINGHV